MSLVERAVPTGDKGVDTTYVADGTTESENGKIRHTMMLDI